METSILLARLIGPLFILVGIGVLLNAKHYREMAANFFKNAELYYFSGAIAFIGGMVLILYHNLWVADWRVIITIIGWMSLFKGAVRILFPTTGSKFAAPFIQSDWALNAGAVLVIIVGAWLAYEGFGG